MSDVDPRLVAAMREQLSRRPEDGGTYSVGGEQLQADVELAVELGAELDVAAYGVALEICELAGELSIAELVADNDYHRAVAFGPFAAELPAGLEVALVVNGERRAGGYARADVDETVAAIGRVLEAAGEKLEPGDRIITGLIVNTPLSSGDEVVAELGELGRVGLRIA